MKKNMREEQGLEDEDNSEDGDSEPEKKVRFVVCLDAFEVAANVFRIFEVVANVFRIFEVAANVFRIFLRL